MIRLVFYITSEALSTNIYLLSLLTHRTQLLCRVYDELELCFKIEYKHAVFLKLTISSPRPGT